MLLQINAPSHLFIPNPCPALSLTDRSKNFIFHELPSSFTKRIHSEEGPKTSQCECEAASKRGNEYFTVELLRVCEP